MFPTKAPSIYSHGDSFLPPDHAPEINAHYTTNFDNQAYTSYGTAPLYPYYTSAPDATYADLIQTQ